MAVIRLHLTSRLQSFEQIQIDEKFTYTSELDNKPGINKFNFIGRNQKDFPMKYAIDLQFTRPDVVDSFLRFNQNWTLEFCKNQVIDWNILEAASMKELALLSEDAFTEKCLSISQVLLQSVTHEGNANRIESYKMNCQSSKCSTYSSGQSPKKLNR